MPNPRNYSRCASKGLCSLFVAVAAVLLFQPRPAEAQFAVGGVYVDSEGVLKQTLSLAPNERLELLRAESADPPASPDLAAGNKLRKVSLRRLDEAVRKLHEGKQPLPAEVRYLAGLSAVKYIFFYPDAGDVVLAGPAAGWTQLPSGEVVGRKSNRPVLHLDDLIVAMRYAFRKDAAAPFIGCSIDPTPGGVQSFNAYMKTLGGRMDRSRIKQIFTGMEEAMGPQTIRLFGIPPSSRFAMKMVAADYRLKRIALAHDPPPVRGVTNYLDLAAKRYHGGAQPQHRWWFLAEYDAVLHTPDGLGFELAGQGVKVTTAPTAIGKTDKSPKDKEPKATPAARQLAASFTKHFPAIAARVPIFAELQNLISLAVTAELIAQKSRATPDAETGGHGDAAKGPEPDKQGSWSPTHFLDAEACSIQQAVVPKQVPSISSHRMAGTRNWLISVSGGVEIDPAKAADRKLHRETEDRSLAENHQKSQAPENPGRWWWD